MKTIRLLFIAALAFTGIGAAIADTSPGVTLSEADAQSQQQLPVGVTSTIRIATNPSTGCDWEISSADNLTIAHPIAIEPDPATPAGVVGAPEIAVIRITPVHPGPASLTLVYEQPWVKQALKTLSYQFVAK